MKQTRQAVHAAKQSKNFLDVYDCIKCVKNKNSFDFFNFKNFFSTDFPPGKTQLVIFRIEFDSQKAHSHLFRRNRKEIKS